MIFKYIGPTLVVPSHKMYSSVCIFGLMDANVYLLKEISEHPAVLTQQKNVSKNVRVMSETHE
jgi:hypothetical protein